MFVCFNKFYNRTTHFCGHIYSMVYKMRFEWLKLGIFFKFWTFSTQSKTNFFFLYFGSIFKLLNQFFFILSCFYQLTVARVIKLFYLFILKTRVIKLLIMYLILKINKYINIQTWCNAVRFVQFSYYKTANHTTPHCTMRCGAVQCGTILLAVQCGYAIL